jgi:hypothetical protein
MNEYAREYAKIELRARRRASFLLTYAPWIVLLTAGAIFGRVWSQTQALRLVEELASLKQEERELLLQRDEHERALVQLSTRARIAVVAREELGMEYPASTDVVLLPVAAPAEEHASAAPRRLERPATGLLAFLQDRLRGIVSRDAYAFGAM